MKNKSVIIILAVVVVFVSITFYNLGFNNGKLIADMAKVQNFTETPSDSISKIDYPLIDVAFNDGNEWIVVIANGIYTESPTYRICEDARELQFNKEYLSILTYPAGRGTTGSGCVIVYKNRQEVKNVEYFDLTFANEEISNKFKTATQDEVWRIIEGKVTE